MKRAKEKYHSLNNVTKAYLQLHLCVFLWGFTAILGKLISVAALSLVWWRVAFTTLSLLFVKRLFSKLREIPRRKVGIYMFIGILVCTHWVLFYASIKASNASVGVLCMALSPIFTAFIEPLYFRRRILWFEILLSLVVIPGMYLVTQNISASMITGLVYGIFSALFASWFSTLNKKYIEDSDPVAITFLELGSAWIFLSVIMLVSAAAGMELSFIPKENDWLYLILLSVACTAVPYVLSLMSLKYISVFATNLTINLEPVYGIFLAWILLQEDKEVDSGFYLGVLIILASVFSYPFLKRLAKF